MQFATDRRSMLKSGLAAAAGLAMPQIMIRAAHAQAEAEIPENPGYRRFTLGTFEITTIQDGQRPSEGPHPIFGQDQPAETVAELLEENFLPSDRFVNGFTPTLVRTESELILFDTGLGEGARGDGLGKLRERLQAAGHQPDDVTIVAITHFHPDHIGGLTEDDTPAFANARYVMGQAEYDFWTAPDRMSGPTEQVAQLVEQKVKPLAERTTFIGDGDEIVPGIAAMEAHGHTPGHLIFLLESGAQRLALTADTANHYVASLQRPEWHVQFDVDKELGAETRKKVFDMIAAERLPFIGYHMPFPSVGFVEKMDVGYRYVPMSYQLDL
jgi:glyoxylase-like metal-dependent hydrolase (beta-lactamase superfamily II)